ncbi:MAG: PEP-utilizing enzyme [Patescibacteria group bacterium]
MKKEDEYISIIRSSGLRHVSSRNLPLITVSCIFFGYNEILKSQVGYQYGTIANIGIKDNAYFLINEDKIGRLFDKFVSKRKEKILIKKFSKKLIDNKSVLKSLMSKNYFNSLPTILDLYLQVLGQIGFYNSMMRYIKDDKNKAKYWRSLFNFVSKDKDRVANLIYCVIEPLLKKSCQSIGRDFNFDGDLLKYMTLREMQEYLLTKRINKKILLTLKKRREGYVYLYYKEKDYVLIDKPFVHKVYKEFIIPKKIVNIIKGVPAYPGKVVGKVFNTFHGLKTVKHGSILVTNVTNPKDNVLLKKFAAIVTNEGGLLSHASIISREFKIPCIIGTKIATQIFKDGDRVEVDANKGIVKLLKKKS